MARRRKAKLTSNMTNNVLIMLVGGIFSLIVDYFGLSYNIGSKTKAPIIENLTIGDVLQIVVYQSMLFYALADNRKDFANFSYGLLMGKMFPSILLPSVGLPRYGVFDIEPGTNKLVPAFVNPFPS